MNDPRLSIIPARAATDPAIKPRDLQVLCVLGRHTDKGGWCRRSQVKMAAEMDCARSTVFAAINRLLKCGYLERHEMPTESGRDSAHMFRVVLDPVHVDVSSMDSDEDFRETSVDLPCRYIGTPAGISAPPAGPESAPPAGPESAPPAGPEPAPPAGPESAPMLTTPINDPSLTTQLNRERGAGVRARETGKERKKLFRQLVNNWPNFVGMSLDTAEREFLRLTPDEQQEAVDKRDDWIALLRSQKKTHTPAPATYCREKLWLAVPEGFEAVPEPTTLHANPFGKLWGAVRFVDLMRAPYGQLPQLNRLMEKMIAAGTVDRDVELRERRAKHGWPAVNDMQGRAINQRKGTTATVGLEPLSELFAQVKVGSPLWQAWADLHHAKGWPWIDAHRLPEWVYMPRPPDDGEGDADAAVRQALAEFERAHAALMTGQTSRDAAE